MSDINLKNTIPSILLAKQNKLVMNYFSQQFRYRRLKAASRFQHQ